ncbi:MAG: hypothetical protein AVDCRST_MAG08-345 [uncultured Acetobacteraceae bacterium]|uniref:rRNA N-glycosidase n=1 Tax=uncultured Acetobacteraceae bacterium TaxID=169975 RepID=A0A6J4H5U0_9PROT|nr:MAG: hypothetical protein AVDCRST_MAG08-345 [uncultured Acetobacteraceae bacterium]
MSGRFASGNIALLHQPGDLRSFIQLSRYLYPFCIKELRRRLENDRSGVEVVEVWAPVDAPRIAVALDRRTLYLFGLRALPGGEWWCFEGYPRPTDPPGAKVRLMSGDGNYASFGWPERISTTPIKLLTDLSVFNGRYNDPQRARHLLALSLLISEAIRFDSLLDEGMRFCASDVLSPARHRDTVTNWAKRTVNRDRDVALPHIPKI